MHDYHTIAVILNIFKKKNIVFHTYIYIDTISCRACQLNTTRYIYLSYKQSDCLPWVIATAAQT